MVLTFNVNFKLIAGTNDYLLGWILKILECMRSMARKYSIQLCFVRRHCSLGNILPMTVDLITSYYISRTTKRICVADAFARHQARCFISRYINLRQIDSLSKFPLKLEMAEGAKLLKTINMCSRKLSFNSQF